MKLSYGIQYKAAWAVAALGAVAAAIAGFYATGHAPSYITSEVAASCALVALICTTIGALLPQVQRTPAKRAKEYHAAYHGEIPPDVTSHFQD